MKWAPGRLASYVSLLLQGKHKPVFDSRGKDIGDYVVVSNAAFVNVSGKKLTEKFYYKHSGYAGGLRKTPMADVMHTNPATVIEKAVYGMLPKDARRRDRMARLHVYNGPEHPYEMNIFKNYRQAMDSETGITATPRLSDVPIIALRPFRSL